MLHTHDVSWPLKIYILAVLMGNSFQVLFFARDKMAVWQQYNSFTHHVQALCRISEYLKELQAWNLTFSAKLCLSICPCSREWMDG